MATNNSWNTNAPLSVANGGTGDTTLTSNGVLVGNGTSAVAITTAGTTGQVLTGNTGAAPTFQASLAGSILNVVVALTNAQIKALHATPITIVAAPAAGSFVNVTSAAMEMHYGGTNAFTNPSGTAIGLYYTNNAGQVVVSTVVSNAALVATANQVAFTNTTALAAGVAYSAVDAKALVITQTGASEIAGNAANNNTITVSVNYQIATL